MIFLIFIAGALLAAGAAWVAVRRHTARLAREAIDDAAARDLYGRYLCEVEALTQEYLLRASPDEEWLAGIKKRAVAAYAQAVIADLMAEPAKTEITEADPGTAPSEDFPAAADAHRAQLAPIHDWTSARMQRHRRLISTRADGQTASGQGEQQIEADVGRASFRRRRLPKPLYLVSLLILGGEGLLYFFSGREVNGTSPGMILVFTILLVTMITGLSFVFFRFTGDRTHRHGAATGYRDMLAQRHRLSKLAMADRVIDTSRAVNQGVGPLSEPAVNPNDEHGIIGYSRTDATSEADERAVGLALDHIATPLPGGKPAADKRRTRPTRCTRPRLGSSRLVEAVALATVAVMVIAVAIGATVFGLRFPALGLRSSAAPQPGVSVVIAATATVNESAPSLPADLLQVLRAVGDSSAAASAYIVSPDDGQPTVMPLTPSGADGQITYGPRRAEAVEANISSVARTLRNEANAGPFDLLATIAMATKDVSSPGTLIVVSSGLSTAGGFDLRQVGWDVNPSSLAAQLKAQKLLPDLVGWRVVFTGLGDVAGHQPALPQPQQATLAAYWTAICQASGAASCSVDKTARPQLASHVTGPAPVVQVPAVTSVAGPRHILTASLPTTLLFPFDSSTLVPSADSILKPLAQQALTRHLAVSITGYTSPDGGNNAYNLTLSARRADAVRDRLIALGLPAKQITQVTGAGTGGKDPNACMVHGHVDEAKCAQLRRVVVVLSPAHASP